MSSNRSAARRRTFRPASAMAPTLRRRRADGRRPARRRAGAGLPQRRADGMQLRGYLVLSLIRSSAEWRCLCDARGGHGAGSQILARGTAFLHDARRGGPGRRRPAGRREPGSGAAGQRGRPHGRNPPRRGAAAAPAVGQPGTLPLAGALPPRDVASATRLTGPLHGVARYLRTRHGVAQVAVFNKLTGRTYLLLGRPEHAVHGQHREGRHHVPVAVALPVPARAPSRTTCRTPSSTCCRT